MARSRKSLRWALFLFLILAAYLAYPTVDRFIELQNNNELLLTAMSLALVILALGLVGVLVRNLVRLIVDRKRGLLGSRLRAKLVFFFLALVLLPATILFIGSTKILKETVEAILRTPLEDLSDESGKIFDQWKTYFQDESLRNIHALAARGPGVYGDRDRLEAWRDEHDIELIRYIANDGTQVEASRPGFRSASGSEMGWLTQLAEQVAREGRAIARIEKGSDGIQVQVATSIQNPGENAITDSAKGRSVGSVPAGIPAVLVTSKRMPEFVSGRLDGLSEAVGNYRRFRIYRRELVRIYLTSIGLIYLATLLIATWIGFYVSRRITGPIQQMAFATREIAAGNLDVRVDSDSGDELGVLVESFNDMAAQLQESRNVITRSTADLRHTNRALDERRRYIETLIDNLSTGVLSLDATGRITTVNAALQEIVGVRLQPGDILTRELRTRNLDVLADCIAPGQTLVIGGIRRDLSIERDGGVRQLSLHLSPLLDGAEKSIGALLMLEDLTDLVQAQRASAWQEVARRIAHEIKNPLTPIQLSAERLRKKFEENPEELGRILPEATSAIVREVGALKDLVDEFSRFARLPEVNPQSVDIRTLIDSVRRLYESVAEIVWHVDVPADLGEARVDPQQLRRVLINLVDNSIAAMDGRGNIELRAERSDGTLRLVVADDGPGIPPGDRDKMFAPYFSTKKRGTGLGLAIVQKVVTDHHGTIRVEENEPQGARFVIELPV